MWILMNCFQYPGCRYLIGRSRLNVLKRTTMKTLIDIIKTNKLESRITINNQTSTINFTNGSEIIFLDLFPYPADPNYDRLGSLEITGAFVDELSEISYKGFEVLFSRIRYKLREYDLTPKLFCASNPTQGWSKNIFYIPYNEGNEKEHIKFIPALPEDNKYLPENYLSGLEKTLTHGLKQRLLYGSWEFDSDEFTLFEYDSLVNCFYNEYFLNTDDGDYITADIAELGNDSTIICVWKGWNLNMVLKLQKSEIVDTVEKIKSLIREYKVPIRNVIIDSVGVGAGVASMLRGCVRYMGNQKPLNKENYRNIKTQLMYRFSDKVNEGLVNFNFEYDEQLVQECLLYKKNIKGEVVGLISKDEIKQKLGRSPDKIDAIYLRAFYDFKQSKTSSFTII